MKLLRRPRVRQTVRYISVCLMLVAAMIAVAIVASLTVDLGPLARRTAETEGSKYIERPMRIGRLSIHVLTGKYVIEDVIIDGLRAGDRPFFTAKRISIAMDWAPAMRLRPEFLITSVELTDWQMLVEKWENGHNMPRFIRDDQPQGPRRFTTTVQYVRASRGQFTYEDHQTPWSIVCPNLDFTLGNVPNYHGQAVFNGGTVQIQNYKPMWANFRARFVLSGPHVDLDRIEIDTDGAKTVARGSVELGKRWPEQSYDFESRVQFPRMGDIFFSDQDWDLTGDGDVTGKFHLFKGGHDLGGTFKSDLLGWNDYRFPALAGSLHWTPAAFDVWDANAKFFGGDAQFTYSMKPLGRKNVRSTSRFEASYENADLAAFTDFQNWRGLRFAGSMSGHNLLEWPTGRFVDRRAEGSATVVPPPGVQPLTARAVSGGAEPLAWGPFAPVPLPAHVPVAAEFAYRFTADNLELDPSYFATDRTHVAFQGATAWGEQSRFAFHVTSRDWQESDQLLAGLIKDFGSSSDAVVAIGGRGEFDGVMTGPFRRARIEGTFTGEDLRAWDTKWGEASGRILYEDDYITVSDGIVRLGASEIRTDGLFSLVTPRPDGRDEIDAQFRVTRRDLESFRHAFQIDEYPLSGRMSGEFRLKGERRRPMGVGSMRIDEGVAYGEPFQNATASLRFDGTGVRLDGIEIAKSTGAITGAAFIGWDSTYSFNADGRRIPVGQIAFLTYPGVPLSGTVELSASGNGTFDVPRNDFEFRIRDLAVDKEAVGQVTGDLALRGTDLSGQIDAASPRLSVAGTGRISLTPDADSEINLRFHDTSIDQYVRLFVPGISASTTAVASGSMHLAGALTDFNHLAVDGTIDALDMRLFDFAVKNAAPIRLRLDRGQVNVQDLQLVGEDTRLRVIGSIGVREDLVGLKISGDANLGILQGFFRDIRGSGRAELAAAVDGSLRKPVFSGSATIAEGRIRHFSLPNALDSINGTVSFDANGIRLDDLTAAMGGGQVRFGGRIGFDGYQPGDLNVTVSGEDMQLRLFEGMRSTFDADLALVGSYRSPTLDGTVRVKSAVWTRRIDAPGSIFDFARRASGGASVIVGEASTTFPLRYDVRIEVPSTLRVDTNLLRLVASADLTLQGSYDRPVIAGHADIERGEVNFEGRRYRITRGAIDFNNPTRIEPFFDIEAETNVRVPGPPVQTYHINVGFAGTTERLQPTVSSEPALPTAEVLALLFSDVRRNNQQDVELRALQNPNQAETDILAARVTQALTAPISAEVGKVVEEAFGVDTFQLTPSFVDPSGQQTSGLNPTARLTIGKRVSDRVYLTFSRSLGTTINDQIVLLEYEESDRLSWILSRNEDQQTYALEFRVRHTF